MEHLLKILMLEDNAADGEIVYRLLKKENPNINFRLSMTKSSYLNDLEEFGPDLILADNSLPQFSATEALDIFKQKSIQIPFILVTGTVSEEFAANIIKQGADDYVLKDRLARLPAAIGAALKNHRSEREKNEARQRLIQSEESLKAIFDNSSEGFILLDEQRVIRAFNSKTKEIVLVNTTEEIAIGKNILDYIEEDRKAQFKATTEKIFQGETIQYDRLFTNPTGIMTWINFTFNPVKKNNIINGICIAGRDITEKKIAEQQQEFDRNNLHALINNTHDLMWSVSRDFKLITANQAFDEMIMLMSGQTYKKGTNILSNIFKEDQIERYKKNYERAFNGESFTELEYNKDPVEFWSEISFYPLYEGKTVIGTACFSRDITEKKKAEDEIKKSNERFEMVVSATNDVIWDWDLVTSKIWWNKNYYSHFGYNREDIGSDISSWHNRIHPDDKERVMLEIRNSAEKREDCWTLEYRFLKANGTPAFVLGCGYILYTNENKPFRMVGAMTDITSRKNAEQDLKNSFNEKQALAQRMSSILNTIPANIALLDANGNIVDVNGAWKNFAASNGFTGNSYAIGDNYLVLTRDSGGSDEKDGKLVAQGIQDVLKNKVDEFVFEYACHSPEAIKWFRMVVTPLKEKEKSGAVVMHIDISQIKRLEQERLQSKINERMNITRAMLQAQEQEKNQLGRELHDNISQLLATIKMKLGFCLAHYEIGIPIVKDCFEHVEEAISETRNLSHRMVIPRFADTGFKAALNDLVTNYSHGQRIITLNSSGLEEEKIPAPIKETIYRIAQEQLNNIEKYAEATKVNLFIGTEGDIINMIVSDNGIGFDSKKTRTGIGITNILNRAESYKGTAKIISAPGKGCRLLIEIPLN